jgi:hypothetical protein
MLNQNIGNLPVNNYNRSWLDDDDFDDAVAHDRIGEPSLESGLPVKDAIWGAKRNRRPMRNTTALAEYESMAMLGPNLGIYGYERRPWRSTNVQSAWEWIPFLPEP